MSSIFPQSATGSWRKIEASGDQAQVGIRSLWIQPRLATRLPYTSTWSLDTLAGSTGVMIRFTFSGTWDFWWAMDNIQVTGFTPCTAPPMRTGQFLHTTLFVQRLPFRLHFREIRPVPACLINGSFLRQSSMDGYGWRYPVRFKDHSTASTYYRCMVTCSGQTDSSQPFGLHESNRIMLLHIR
jgi:hypothetical protein